MSRLHVRSRWQKGRALVGWAASLLTIAVAASVSPPSLAAEAAPAPGGLRARSESELAGRWAFSERELVIELYKARGAWQGVIRESPRREEVGHWLVRNGRLDPKDGLVHAELVRPGDSSGLDATLTLTDETTLKVTGRKLFFTKTFHWKRR